MKLNTADPRTLALARYLHLAAVALAEFDQVADDSECPSDNIEWTASTHSCHFAHLTRWVGADDPALAAGLTFADLAKLETGRHPAGQELAILLLHLADEACTALLDDMPDGAESRLLGAVQFSALHGMASLEGPACYYGEDRNRCREQLRVLLQDGPAPAPRFSALPLDSEHLVQAADAIRHGEVALAGLVHETETGNKMARRVEGEAWEAFCQVRTLVRWLGIDGPEHAPGMDFAELAEYETGNNVRGLEVSAGLLTLAARCIEREMDASAEDPAGPRLAYLEGVRSMVGAPGSCLTMLALGGGMTVDREVTAPLAEDLGIAFVPAPLWFPGEDADEPTLVPAGE